MERNWQGTLSALYLKKRRAMMPTFLRLGAYRFFFFSKENNEPPYIHVSAPGKEAKFWLVRTELASSYGMRPHELTQLMAIVNEHRGSFLEAWNEHFMHTA